MFEVASSSPLRHHQSTVSVTASTIKTSSRWSDLFGDAYSVVPYLLKVLIAGIMARYFVGGRARHYESFCTIFNIQTLSRYNKRSYAVIARAVSYQLLACP